MKKNKKPPPPPSRGSKGTAAARQMGLLMDFSPENMMDSDGEDNHELEAEFLAIVGGQPDPKQKPNGKTPLPMEAIERMAALCMKDLEEEDGVEEEGLEDDDELMAELTEVLEEDGKAPDVVPAATEAHDAPAASNASESILLERLAMYKAAVVNAKQAGESSKMRRYERGLKTLENLLTSVRKGKKIDEDEIPPPVATGKSSNCQQAAPLKTTPASQPATPEGSAMLINHFTPEPPAAALEQSPSKSSPVSQLPPKAPPPKLPKPKISPATGLPLRSPGTPLKTSAPSASSLSSDAPNSSPQAVLQARVREYKLAALRSKQEGNIEMATKYYRLAKSFEPILESLGKGEAVDLSNLPPPPDELSKEMMSSPLQQTPVAKATPLAQAVTPPAQGVSSAAERPAPPRDMMEALQQRMDRYKTAAAQAKSKGEDRKARMHERIVKQYQEAIRAHKAGKPVEFADLPVPPGFPPIQGMESLPRDQSLAGILEIAVKLANEDEDAEETKKPDIGPASSKPAPSVQPKLPHQPGLQVAPAAAKTAPTGKSAPKAIAKAQQQLTFLENRKKQLKQAALRAKQQNDIEGAKLFLCQAKGLDPMIEASQSGLPVDISKVPQAPVNKEEFMLVQRCGANISPGTAAQYTELVKLMRQQHEMCISYSKQFTHLGNITETIKFEKMAEDCKKNMEILKQAHAKGLPLPKYHYEQRTFSVIKIFPELNSNDMILSIVKGINLPAPPGISPGDLDAFVRFEFPYPNVEEAQKGKTNVIKNSNCPEFQEKFKLFINRSHRGFKRAIQSKGIKFEVVHKGGLFKNDRVVGTAQLKLEALETTCELREILELLDGRRPTGGRLEVIVRLREPLTSQQLETTTEKWLVIDPLTGPPAAFPKPKPAVAPVKVIDSGKPACSLYSFNVLAFDKERLEKKIVAYNQAGQPPPSDLVEQHQNIIQKINWQKSQLQHGGAAVMKEYLTRLEQYQQWYTEAAKRLGNEGKREAAKDALYKRNLVERELQKFRK
ncbi:coiled-coil and C2 domain-containing protein 1A [Python bivittatus]|uniref:Coiled-coil and C2 domain-containing protein 1B n=1 Tax=Python bivittatus TaxID=176946 RepID=A0A9F2NQG2_PYTBI|nr:coiled-coil and C2 domain-containing protein 1A [Python bivittatus]XP_007425918.1 coiled-coil and C2 domain-containing protein 1A [Python bivittatus]XP_025020969.1 coiled-coil and C2 domain-containing protein 1A [Python bivittatus]XP_025020970.1 coiled-coil and C2 domain-containing protein 1A [Python bivittatus]